MSHNQPEHGGDGETLASPQELMAFMGFLDREVTARGGDFIVVDEVNDEAAEEREQEEAETGLTVGETYRIPLDVERLKAPGYSTFADFQEAVLAYEAPDVDADGETETPSIATLELTARGSGNPEDLIGVKHFYILPNTFTPEMDPDGFLPAYQQEVQDDRLNAAGHDILLGMAEGEYPEVEARLPGSVARRNDEMDDRTGHEEAVFETCPGFFWIDRRRVAHLQQVVTAALEQPS